jgi:hypothetical protein
MQSVERFMTYPVKSDKSSEHLVSVIIPAFNAEELSWIMHVRSFCATGTPCYQGVSHQVKVPIRTLLIHVYRSRSYPVDWKLYFEADNMLIWHGFLLGSIFRDFLPIIPIVRQHRDRLELNRFPQGENLNGMSFCALYFKV